MKAQRFQHVFSICLDSLRADRLLAGGARMDFCPTINRLAAEGLFCSQTFSHGCFTQFSAPSIFTSTLPLDYGGYDTGILHRPLSMAEVFRRRGFVTGGFHPSYWQAPVYGYARGFDVFQQYCEPQKIWTAFLGYYVGFYLRLRGQGIITAGETRDILGPIVQRAFQAILAHCRTFRWNIVDESAGGQHAERVYAEFRHYASFLEAELEQMKRDPAAYLALREKALSHWSLRGFLDYVKTDGKGSAVQMRLKAELNWQQSRIARFASRLFTTSDLVPYSLAGNLFDNVLGWLKTLSKDSSAFVWAHPLDIHDWTYARRDVLPFFLKVLRNRLRRLSDYSIWDFGYDLSVFCADRALTKFLTDLKSLGMLDRSLISIHSDHGISLPGSPHAKSTKGYDDKIHVPVIFRGRGIESRDYPGLSGLIDMAPTLVDLMGWEPQGGFGGLSVLSPDHRRREHVIFEHLGSGPGDLSRRELNLAVRTRNMKLICREDGPATCIFKDHELYDLNRDPGELNNCFGDPRYGDSQAHLVSVAAARCREIRRQTVALNKQQSCRS